MLEGTRRLGAELVALGLAVVVAACGGSSNNNSSNNNNSFNSGGRPDTGAMTGGTINIGTVGPDSYDPVMFQTVQANSALHLAYTPLLSYKDATGAEGSKLVPGLAESIPEPENGGLSYTFKLRPGLKYSDGTPVKASDFENTME